MRVSAALPLMGGAGFSAYADDDDSDALKLAVAALPCTLPWLVIFKSTGDGSGMSKPVGNLISTIL